MNKYGDYYLYLDLDDDLGIVNAQPLSCYETRREEGYDLDKLYVGACSQSLAGIINEINNFNDSYTLVHNKTRYI